MNGNDRFDELVVVIIIKSRIAVGLCKPDCTPLVAGRRGCKQGHLL